MVISIFTFLEYYYGAQLDPRMHLNHKNAKKKYRLKCCSFQYAKNNPELIKNGGIIYVKDTYGVMLPYFCPEKKRKVITEDKYVLSDEIEKLKDCKRILENLADMPTYLVGQLLSEYKYIPSFSRIIKKELKNRGVYDNKKHKLKKEILENELEEGVYNDKYQRRRKIKCKKS